MQAPANIMALFNGCRQVVYGFVPNCTQVYYAYYSTTVANYYRCYDVIVMWKFVQLCYDYADDIKLKLEQF